MNILSLFSGVGGMDLGLERAGHEIVAMCEIDKHARGVLAHHWPNIPLHEDVTTLDGRQYRGSVDVVSGGSPCQDLSVAGRRKGLDGARSGLFWHQCRIADECAAPWFLWENVPGALSSNLGADFAAVLWGVTGAYPRVPDGGWHNSGVIVGPKRWAVWRVLDAQYFGVAQRRRRVFVVGGPRTDMRPEILLESTGLPGDHAPSRTPREEITGTLTRGLGSGGPDAAHALAGWLIPSHVAETADALLARDYKDVNSDGHDSKLVAFVKAVRSGARDADGNLPPEVWKPDHTSPTLSAFDNNSETRATVLAINENQRAEIVMTDIAHSITSGGGKPGQGYPAILSFEMRTRDGAPQAEITGNNVAGPLRTGTGGSSKPMIATVLAFGWQENHHAGETHTEQTTALTTTKTQAIHSQQHGVRRLTPIECERLMGWPDNWTLHTATGKQADSHRYRQTGNGVVANVTQWIGNRLNARNT